MVDIFATCLLKTVSRGDPILGFRSIVKGPRGELLQATSESLTSPSSQQVVVRMTTDNRGRRRRTHHGWTERQ